jgi:hypothetical protein
MRKEVKRMEFTLKAITAEGFGCNSVYTETVKVANEDALNRARIDFALKYNVCLDNVVVEKEI